MLRVKDRNLITVERWDDENVFVRVILSLNTGLQSIKPDLAFQRYVSGQDKPHYPVPAKIGQVGSLHTLEDGYEAALYLMPADNSMYSPLITWWNESFGLPLPEWHGAVDRWEYPNY